ncbi:MAG TPA: class I SAM-dependent methyltransferase [Thermoanaerobaculaceae bacterium]|nr:class I SAM-dependent methyltransferase [Thermoanaerobaculaceae bacterium]
MEEPRQPTGDGLKPHPTLDRYYDTVEDRERFVRRMFDAAAADYERVERRMAFGSGRWYRREALKRAGLGPGMRVLDVAIGTGLVAREAARLSGGGSVIGLDPSVGMLLEARRQLRLGGVLGLGEQIPIADASFDFLSMGYGLRHLADLTVAFREFLRVLKPGGKVCLLELTRPDHAISAGVIRFYLRRIVPLLTRLRTRSADAEVMMRYFWDTVENCVPPGLILSALDAAGFADVQRALAIGLFSEYTGRRPYPGETVPPPAPTRTTGNFFVRRIAR